MGGEGSGRKPDVTNQVLRNAREERTPILSNGNEPMYLPNYSGIKDSARKDRPIDTKLYASAFSSIQEAINALPSTGGMVVLDAKTYTITSAITINKSNVFLIGQGSSSIIFLNANTNASCITMTSVDNITLSDFVIDGNKDNQADNNSAINVVSCNYYSFKNLEVKNASHHGMRIDSSSGGVVTNCYVHDVEQIGIYFYKLCHNNKIESNYVHDCGYEGIGIGDADLGASTYNVIANNVVHDTVDNLIDMHGSHDCVIIGNNVHHGKSGVTIDSGYKNVICNNNIYDVTDTAINLSDTDTAVTEDKSVIANNRIETAAGYGILNTGMHYNIICGNNISDTTSQNIAVNGDTHDTFVTGNICDGTIAFGSSTSANTCNNNVATVTNTGTNNLINAFNGITDTSLTANSIIFTDANKKHTTDADLTFDGTKLSGNQIYASSYLSAAETSIPTGAKLSVKGNTADYTNTNGANALLWLNNASSTGQNVIMSRINGTNVAKWRTDYAGNINWIAYNGYHAFYTGGDYPTGTVKMYIAPSGEVGIGTTSPYSMLDVVGDIRVSSPGTFITNSGAAGITDTINLATATSITVENGIITGYT